MGGLMLALWSNAALLSALSRTRLPVPVTLTLGIALGALTANISLGTGPGATLMITVGNTLAPLAAWYLLMWQPKGKDLSAARDRAGPCRRGRLRGRLQSLGPLPTASVRAAGPARRVPLPRAPRRHARIARGPGSREREVTG